MLRILAVLSCLFLPALAIAQAPATQPATKPAVAVPKPVVPPVRPTATATASGSGLIDVNSADEKTLDTLPGVGPARAKAIVENRPYADKQDLVNKKALPANVFALIQDRIALANVNTATAAVMAKILPNVGPVRAQQIVDKRPYATAQDLVVKGALTQGVFDGLKGLITTGP